MTTPSQLTINSVDVATSSSDLAWDAASDAAPAGTAFLVGEQTRGRGRRGASWLSGRGGMYLSILLRPDLTADRFFGLSFVAALAIREEVSRYLAGVPVTLNGRTTFWPVAGSCAYWLRRAARTWLSAPGSTCFLSRRSLPAQGCRRYRCQGLAAGRCRHSILPVLWPQSSCQAWRLRNSRFRRDKAGMASPLRPYQRQCEGRCRRQPRFGTFHRS